MADPDEALVEAIAEAIVGVDAIAAYPARPEAWYPEARAAYAAMVAHLGLKEERVPVDYWFKGSKATVKLSTPWREVESS